MSGQHVLFDVAGTALAVPAAAVQAIHDDLAVQPVAGTKAWFKGLAVARGNLLPVTDLGRFIGGRASSGRTLELAASVGIAGLMVDTVYGLSDAEPQRLPAAKPQSLSADGRKSALTLTLAVTLAPWVVQQDGRDHQLMDVAALVQHPGFIDIADTGAA